MESVNNMLRYNDISEKQKFPQCVKIKSICDVKRYLGDYLSTNVANYAFRGVNNAAFCLYSSLQRYWLEKGYDNFDTVEYIKYQIRQVRNDRYLMKNLATDANNSITDYNILAMIQHYGGRSALIDFSYSPQSAMFFAFDRVDKKNASDIDDIANYVSFYVLEYSNAELAGPTDVYDKETINGKNSGDFLNDELEKEGIPLSQIDASSVLTDFEMMPYNKIYDGKLVHGGLRSCINTKIPFFNFQTTSKISNENLKAQDGCFVQGFSDKNPLDENETLRRHLKCFNIHKCLIDNIIHQYNIPTDRDTIYPPTSEKKMIEEHVQALDNIPKSGECQKTNLEKK
ncbi:MAG: FRG domain-containing protein [Prevotellaceae bacterium]|jgi:hypothetical protein|nr:FRG domain-containing protein [Prevotellaceae bacterium]